MAFWLAYINIALAVFNLIPGFPLDGGRVFRSFLWRVSDNYGRSSRIAARVGQGVGYSFILGGIVMMVLLRDWFGGLWLAFIGWFLHNAASTSYRQVQWREQLRRFTALEAITAGCPVVSPNTTISGLVQEYTFATGHGCFLVAEESELLGVLTLHNIKAIAQADWGITAVKEVMTPVDKLKVAYANQDALSVLERMDESNIKQMPLVSEGRVIGLVTRDNLVRLLSIRSLLGK